MPPTIYLVTGANRGIGFALVREIVARPEVIVFAAARKPSEAEDLKRLADTHPGKIQIVPYVAGDVQVTHNLVKTIQEKHGYIDIVIAVAATATFMGTAEETPAELLKEHLDINVVGVLELFQSTVALLKSSKNTPKFIPFTSAAGSLTAFPGTKLGYTCYGASKAALNFIARRIHIENEWLTCFPLSPSIVKTESAKSLRESDKSGVLGKIQDQIALPADTAATMLMKVIDTSTREKEGGEFMSYDGTKISW